MFVTKSMPAQVKDLSVVDRTVTGYFARFGSTDYDMDVFEPGAFAKTIAEWGPEGKNKIQHLYQHDTWRPLAKPKVLRTDDFGVYFESQFADTSWGRDAIKLYEAGVINEHSVGFQIIRSSADTVDGKEIQRIQEVRMWEGSTVTFGANEDTPFMGLKSVTRQHAADHMDKLIKAVRNGTFTDETFHLLEIQLAQVAQFIKDLPDAPAARKDTDPGIAPGDVDAIIDNFTIKHLVKWN